MKTTRKLTCVILAAIGSMLSWQCQLASAQDSAPKPGREAAVSATASEITMNELEQKFAKKLTGATMVGRFTLDGQSPTAKAHDERYVIETARKLNNDDYWVIVARVKYGKHDLTVPVTLKVLWAGDTPVMSLTDLTIPLLGTFTARVMFHGNRYVGTWQHGDKGGHMLGYLQRTEPAGGNPVDAKPADK